MKIWCIVHLLLIKPYHDKIIEIQLRISSKAIILELIINFGSKFTF
jgi:hypothetical protein